MNEGKEQGEKAEQNENKKDETENKKKEAQKQPPKPAAGKKPNPIRDLAQDVSSDEESVDVEKGEQKMSKAETDSLIKDVMNVDSTGKKFVSSRDGEKAERRKFKQKEMVKEEGFSILTPESFIDRFGGITVYIVRAVFGAVVSAIILAPSLILAVLKGVNPMAAWTPLHVRDLKKLNVFVEDVRISLFLAAVFMMYCIVKQLGNDLLYLLSFILKFSGVAITTQARTFFLVLKELREMITMAAFFLLALLLSNVFLCPYAPFQKIVNSYMMVGGCCLWCFFLMYFLLMEKLILKLSIAYFGNEIFKGRISEINYKAYVLRKIQLYGQAKARSSPSLLDDDDMRTFPNTQGYMIHYKDLSFKTADDVNAYADNVFALLGIYEIKKELINTIFDHEAQAVWECIHCVDTEKAPETSTEITFEVFKAFAGTYYQDRTDLKRTLYDRDKLLSKLDFLFAIVAVSFAMMFTAVIFEVDPKAYFAGVVPVFVGTSWIFADTIKDVFNNFLFLLHEHAYDVGDKVILGGEIYRVLRIDLMYTTFKRADGTVCYMPNKELIKEKVFNIKRSDLQSEDIVITLKGDIAIKTIYELQDQIVKFLKEREKDYTGKFLLKNYRYAEGKTVLKFSVEHNSNFQDSIPRYRRRNEFLQTLKDLLKKDNLEYIEEAVPQ